MKKIFFPVLLLFILSCSAIGQSTNLFIATGVQITPANPTPNDSIFINISGFRLDSCAELNSATYLVDLNNVNITMDWFLNQNSGTQCLTMANIPYDTTINIGTLLPGFYTINLFGLIDSIPNAQRLLTVATANCFDVSNGDIWVTSNFDTGTGTLREAINCANNTPGPNTIKFNILSLNPGKIFVGSLSQTGLPAITDPGTTIDGTTQPGWGQDGSNEPIIEISGISTNNINAPNGLTVQANNTQIYGVRISDFAENGIIVESSNPVIIGAPAKGNAFFSNGEAGIYLTNGTANCQIASNWIGTDHSLATNLGNGTAGVHGKNGGVNSSVGLGTPASANIIYQNAVGVIVDGVGGFSISQNDFRCNGIGIELLNNGNFNQAAPIISLATVNGISGQNVPPGSVVEVFINEPTNCSDAGCQGAIYLGTTSSNALGWSLNPPFANGITLQGGERIAATLRVGSNQSPFSDCAVVRGVSTCTDSQGVIEVTNTNDSGAGSLRDAIDCANLTFGGNLIEFNIPSASPYIISVGQVSGLPLPTLMDAGTIIDADGSEVILDGGATNWSLPADGLTIETDLCEIYGLTIRNFADDGISLSGANGNKIGAAGKGNTIYGNGDAQDFWPGITGGPFDGSGIHLSNASSGNTIFNNSIGTNAAGTIDSGNEFCGILVTGNSSNNSIGSSMAGTGNRIENNESGIVVTGPSVGNELRQLSLACNTTEGILLSAGANNDVLVPSVTEARTDSIFGTTAIQSGTVDLYLVDNSNCSNAPCQGKTLLASQTISNGEWLFMPPYNGGAVPIFGDIVTLVFTDTNGNSSSFANCTTLAAPCFLQLNINNLVHTTCGLDNGEFELEANNGTAPYLYDIGNGQTNNTNFTDLAANFYIVVATDVFGCTVEELVNINGSQSISANLVGNTDATCNLANGALEFLGSNGVAPYVYSLNGGMSQDSGIFAGLSAGSYQIDVIDAEGCTAVNSAVVSNVGLLPVSSFAVSTNFDTLTITDQSVFADSYLYTFGDGNSSADSNPIHVYGQSGQYEVCQTVTNSCGPSTSCQMISVTPAPSLFLVAGSIFREDLSPINNAELTCVTTDVSDINGNYLIENIPIGSNCSLEPIKNDNAADGLTVTDIVLIQRHVILLDTLDSPYKIIAADVNDSGDITVSDLISIQRVILLLDDNFSINKSWRFIPEEYSFPDPLNPLDSNFPEEILFNGLTSDVFGQDFIGMKLGDVNNSASTINVAPNAPISLYTVPVVHGDIAHLEIRVGEQTILNGLQGKINFDQQHLQLKSMNNSLSNLKYNASEDAISFIWYDELGEKSGRILEQDELLFSLEFNIVGEEETTLSEVLNLEQTGSLSFDFEHGERTIQLEIEENFSLPNPSSPIFYPNPFTDQLFVKNAEGIEKDFNWELIDLQGKVRSSGNHLIGEISIQSNFDQIPPGIYFLKTTVNGNPKLQRLLKLAD